VVVNEKNEGSIDTFQSMGCVGMEATTSINLSLRHICICRAAEGSCPLHDEEGAKGGGPFLVFPSYTFLLEGCGLERSIIRHSDTDITTGYAHEYEVS
jgi:hypothetical protein